MTHVIGEACIGCKQTDCVDVCPVDCFREGPNFLVIDPNECIDCTACVPECPEGAIYMSEDIPEEQAEYIALNAALAQKWPSITKSKPAPADAYSWRGKKNKLSFLKVDWHDAH